MKSFDWEDYYATGIATVDDQHRHLVDLINELGDLLSSNGIRRADIERVLEELALYAREHFQDEEKMMRVAGIDQRHFADHVAIHNSFLEEIRSGMEGHSAAQEEAAGYLLDFLTNWLAYHILGMDQNMARQIASIRKGMSPEDAYDFEEREADRGTKALLSALNNLFEQVASRNKRLVEFNQTLEAKVQARTNELFLANERLKVLSLTDPLTGLPNRRHAIARLSSMWNEAVESGRPLACLMIDADHFKEVNDTYGHEAGDVVLQALGRVLMHSVRSDDLTARLGGDEFLILCPDTDGQGGQLLAEQVRDAVSQLSVSVGDGSWQGSVSVGVAAIQPYMERSEELIKLADRAVYAAKSAGRSCVRSA